MSDPLHTEETRTARPGGSLVSPSVRAGDKVGRFSILAEVGVGGMGRIYEAYDPNLDRRIALKLLRDSGEDGQRQRLVREAQALARLDHPNVVRVHDVGVHEGALFVAMEFVRGGTLKAWLSKNPVGTKARFDAAVQMLVDAGRGLVAAHEAGLVHRDVKPSNILIGDDGRARIADFGIARATEALPSPSKTSDSSASEVDILLSTDDSESGLTRTGVAVGTPAYMAPEQFGRGQVGAAADQFSFCVTAWETLFGVRPFAGADTRERLGAIRTGQPKRPEEVEVDAELVALLERGLRYRASARHRQLEELVDALGPSSGSSRRSVWRWGLAIVGMGLLGTGGAYRMGQNQQLCTGARAAFEGVWGDEQRGTVRAAVLGSGLEFAPGAWARLEAGLDAYGEGWRDAHTEACEATRVRDEQSPERMEERLACLDDARRSVHALVALVSSGERSVIANERELLEGLPPVEDCADVRGVPTAAELALLDAVARAGAQRSAGQPREALRIIEPIVDRLDDETSSIVKARVLLEYGRGLSEGQGRKAIDVLSDAYSVAHAAGLGQVAAAAARDVTRQHALSLGKPATVRTWLELAKSESTASVSEQYELLMLEGMLLSLEGDTTGSAGAFERSVALASGNPVLLPQALRRRAENLKRVDPVRAVGVGREALEKYQEQFSSNHPGAAVFEESLAGLLARVGENGEADALARRALRHATDVWGAGHVATSRYLARLSEVRCGLFADRDEGRRLAEDARRLQLEGETTPSRYQILSALEGCVRSHEPAAAKEISEQLLELSKELYGEEHFRTAYVRAMYGLALLETSDVAGARKQVWLATALTDNEAPGWDVHDASDVHRVLAGVASHLNEGSIALRHAEAALELGRTTDAALPKTRVFTPSDLCAARRVVGEAELALPVCLADLEQSEGVDQPLRRAGLEYGVGALLNRLHRDSEALPHIENAARLFEEHSGARSYYTAMTALRLGLINESLGRDAEAEKHFRTSSELFETFGRTQASVVDALCGLARTAARQGRIEEALALLDGQEGRVGLFVDLEHAQISQNRGLVLHLQNPRDGAREYSQAIRYYRFARYDELALRVCEEAPFDLPECRDSGTQPN